MIATVFLLLSMPRMWCKTYFRRIPKNVFSFEAWSGAASTGALAWFAGVSLAAGFAASPPGVEAMAAILLLRCV